MYAWSIPSATLKKFVEKEDLKGIQFSGILKKIKTLADDC